MTRLPSLFLALIALVSVVSAQNNTFRFNAPEGGFSGMIGGDCNIGWLQDTTGNWTYARIDLMTGPDMMRRSLGPISNDTIDATKDSTSTSWKCPNVTPGNIYFYRMSRTNSPTGLSDAIYTTRFCIYTDPTNQCTAPHAYQPTGETDSESWGRGYHRNSILEQVNGGDQAVSFFRANNTDL